MAKDTEAIQPETFGSDEDILKDDVADAGADEPLDEDEVEEPKKKSAKQSDEKPDEDDEIDDDEEKPAKEEKEEKDEDDDEDDEDEERKIPAALDRPSMREIKAKYPDFFKDFPSLRDAIFREREFTGIFPTVEDAREALESNEAFEVLQEAALSGNPTPLLESLQNTDKQAYKTFALSFLSEMHKRDSDTYQMIITPLLENLIKGAYKSRDENLKNSAINIAEYLWGEGGEDIASGKKTMSQSVQVTEEQRNLERSRAEQTSLKFQAMYSEVDDLVRRDLKALVLKDFDPNKTFSKLVRSQLGNEVVRRIFKQLTSDDAHKTVMGARWKRAKANGYTTADKDKIVSTFLARAKALVPATREKVRKAALGDSSTAAKNRVPVEHTVQHPKELRGGRVTNARPPAPKVDYRKMSDLDILNAP